MATEGTMGKNLTTLTVTNHADQIIARQGFLPKDQIRSITLNNALVDTDATTLCLPNDAMAQRHSE